MRSNWSFASAFIGYTRIAVRPDRANRVASSSAFWMAGRRNASVFPDPVPVVTTTGLRVWLQQLNHRLGLVQIGTVGIRSELHHSSQLRIERQLRPTMPGLERPMRLKERFLGQEERPVKFTLKGFAQASVLCPELAAEIVPIFVDDVFECLDRMKCHDLLSHGEVRVHTGQTGKKSL